MTILSKILSHLKLITFCVYHLCAICYNLKTSSFFFILQLVDFGSAECKISRFLVQIPTLEKLALVDLDGDLLDASKWVIRPLILDHIVRRDVKLDVKVYQGSVTALDKSILGYEAVTMVEMYVI